MGTYTTIIVARSHANRVATVTMNRAEVHNAMNTQLIEDLKAALHELSADNRLHAVVLTGAGKSFSAGADLTMMQAAANYSAEQNKEEARSMRELFALIDEFPTPVVARVNGAALGGGLGLLAACDIVIAVDSARLAFSEVKLGIAPAMISPYVVRKIGSSWARKLFATGERFTPALAREIGLVHTVVPLAELDASVEGTIQDLLSSAPQAIRVCKTLARTVGQMDEQTTRIYTVGLISKLRVSPEGQEGLRAFLEKRKPAWLTTEEAE